MRPIASRNGEINFRPSMLTTLPPLVLAQVRATVHMQANTSYHVNIGIDRPNIAWFVKRMAGGKKSIQRLLRY